MNGVRRYHLALWAAVVCSMHACASSSEAQAIADRVRLVRGSESGEIVDMTPTEVSVKKDSAGVRTIAVNEIKSVAFDGDPPELAQARFSATNGNHEKALELLARIDVKSVRREFIKQEIEFYRAYCAGKRALVGQGEISEAGRQLNNFVRSYPKNYHYLAATELMGDLLMASQRYEQAQKKYAELAQTPWPEYRVRASVALGRTLQAQGKHDEAIATFDAALALPDENGNVAHRKLSAVLAKAVSVAAKGHIDEAVGSIEKVIQDTDPQEKELHARAYNALGGCYEQAGKTKDALLAYLHVDVLYNTVPDAHAEALTHLVPLWQAIGQEDRAREAREALQERYSAGAAARGNN